MGTWSTRYYNFPYSSSLVFDIHCIVLVLLVPEPLLRWEVLLKFFMKLEHEVLIV